MAKVGRPLSIESPEIMWDHFFKYKEIVKGNPIKVKDWVGKDGNQVNREKEKPLTYEGFQNYLDDQDVITDISDYFENKDGRYAIFVHVCSRIKRSIRQDQIEGGMAGIYNPSITQRLNGLVEKKEIDMKVEQPLFPD